MASPVIIDINFRRLLRTICTKFSLPSPGYGVSLDATGRFRSFVDVAVPRAGPLMEMLTCWGTPSSNVVRKQEAAARAAVEKLRDELHFEIRDSNYEDRRFFETLYNQVAGDYDELQDQHELLKVDYCELKGQFTSLVAENSRVSTEWNEVKVAIDRCYAVLNNPNAVRVGDGVAPSTAAPAANAAVGGDAAAATPTEKDLAKPPGYRE